MTEPISATPLSRSSFLKLVSRFRRWEASGILVALVILAGFLSVATPNFLSQYNLSVVARQASFVGLVALGQTLVLLIGGIDLSVGASRGHFRDRWLPDAHETRKSILISCRS